LSCCDSGERPQSFGWWRGRGVREGGGGGIHINNPQAYKILMNIEPFHCCLDPTALLIAALSERDGMEQYGIIYI